MAAAMGAAGVVGPAVGDVAGLPRRAAAAGSGGFTPAGTPWSADGTGPLGTAWAAAAACAGGTDRPLETARPVETACPVGTA